ncbi:lantibiotic dehydratase [Kitasatospora sp. NPDC091335]|uniref:lantibiotic dehydratase n=1 Tax=Kitasatospora sp. NPDC091335 TaxID=3364085 RepID=UPI003815EC49
MATTDSPDRPARPGSLPAPSSPRWSLAPTALVRQAGFPLELLSGLVDEGADAQARALLDRHAALLEAAAAAKEELKRSPVALSGPVVNAIGNSIGMLRPLTEPDLAAALRELGPRSGPLAAFQEAVTELRRTCREFTEAHAERLWAGRLAVAGAFADERLRDVLLLSNDAAAPQFLAWLDAFDPTVTGRRRAHAQKMTDLLTMYLQRVTMKNETHSHFGPLNVARVGGEGMLDWTSGSAVRRRAHVSHWAAARLARKLGEDPALRGLVRPRRLPLALLGRGDGDRGVVDLYSSGVEAAPGVDWRFDRIGGFAVDPPQEWLLRHCDGVRTAEELAAEWNARFGPLGCSTDDGSGFDKALADLADRGLVTAWPEVPVGDPRPLVALRGQLLAAGSGDHPAMEWTAGLEAAVAAFTEAPYPERPAALAALKARFEELTAGPANRFGGHHYADRSVVWEEAHGELDDLRIGSGLAAVLSEELAFVYEIALAAPRLRLRLETGLLTRWFRDRFGPDRPVPLADFYRAFVEDRERLALRCAEVTVEVDRLRATVAGHLLGTADPAAREVVVPDRAVRELRAALPREPAAFCNPDVLLAADGPEALAAGELQIVVGELHAGRDLLTHSSMSVQAAERSPLLAEEVYAHYRTLVDEDELLVDVLRGHQDKTASQQRFPGPDLEILGRSPKDRADVLHPSDLHLVLAGDRLELRAEGRPGRLRLLAPPAGGYTLMDDPLAPFAFPRLHGGNGLELDGLPHVPRIRHGRTVLQRELWRVPASELRGWSPTGSPVKADDAAEYLTVCRLRARYGWPRRVFAKLPGQPKPVYVDWDAPLIVRQFFRLVRGVEGTVVISELLPTAEQRWLRVNGASYTSELRYAVFAGPAAASAASGAGAADGQPA